MARLTQSFAQLLHAVSIHDDGVPATHVRTYGVWLIYLLHKQTIIQLNAAYILFTQKLHSVSDISPHDAAGGRSHTAPDG